MPDWYHEMLVFRQGRRIIVEHETVSVGGPGCFAADVIARDRLLPTTDVGDVLAVLTAGAYTNAMRNHYTGRGRSATIAITEAGKEKVVSSRPSVDDLYRFDL